MRVELIVIGLALGAAVGWAVWGWPTTRGSFRVGPAEPGLKPEGLNWWEGGTL